MMPTFYANSVLIHLNDTGEISHEIGEEVFMSETIKIIQGGQTASLMEMRLIVWDYEHSPNGIYIVPPMPFHYLCQGLLFPAAGRTVQLARRRPAPRQSLSLCWGSRTPLGFAGRCHSEDAQATVREAGAIYPIGAYTWRLQRVHAHLLLSCRRAMSKAELFGNAHFQSKAILLILPPKFPRREINQVLPDSACSFLSSSSPQLCPRAPPSHRQGELFSWRTCIKSLNTLVKLHAAMLILLVKLQPWEILHLLSLCSPVKWPFISCNP